MLSATPHRRKGFLVALVAGLLGVVVGVVAGLTLANRGDEAPEKRQLEDRAVRAAARLLMQELVLMRSGVMHAATKQRWSRYRYKLALSGANRARLAETLDAKRWEAVSTILLRLDAFDMRRREFLGAEFARRDGPTTDMDWAVSLADGTAAAITALAPTAQVNLSRTGLETFASRWGEPEVLRRYRANH